MLSGRIEERERENMQEKTSNFSLQIQENRKERKRKYGGKRTSTLSLHIYVFLAKSTMPPLDPMVMAKEASMR